MEASLVCLVSGWLGIFGGALSGAITGLFFHDDEWMGGYGSFRRRLIRLGHVSFFGLGILNILAGLTFLNIEVAPGYGNIAAIGLVIALISMPACCYLAAWRKPFRHLFPLPVSGAFVGIVGILVGWYVL